MLVSAEFVVRKRGKVCINGYICYDISKLLLNMIIEIGGLYKKLVFVISIKAFLFFFLFTLNNSTIFIFTEFQYLLHFKRFCNWKCRLTTNVSENNYQRYITYYTYICIVFRKLIRWILCGVLCKKTYLHCKECLKY